MLLLLSHKTVEQSQHWELEIGSELSQKMEVRNVRNCTHEPKDLSCSFFHFMAACNSVKF